MEQAFGIIIAIGMIVGIRLLFSYGARTLHAVGRAAIGKGSLADNMQVAFQGLGPFQIRFNDLPLGDDGKGGIAKEIQVKGLLPVNRSARLAFITSVFDNTSEKLVPVISGLAEFQEPHTIVYQQRIEIGNVNAGIGFVGWIRAGVVLPQILSTPYGGQRKLLVLLRLIDIDDPPNISEGFHSDNGTIFATYSLPFDFLMQGAGYREALELRAEARALCVQIGVYVAMADGVLEEREGQAIQEWMKKTIDASDLQGREALKIKLNTAMKDAYQSAKTNELVLSNLTQRLADIADAAIKYELVELCYDVAMMGSGDARVVEKIARVLNLDLSEIEKIRDIKIVGRGNAGQPINIEQLLGIESGWDREMIKRHLRNEFQKWNNRVTALPEGEERAVAQRMLEAISEARKTYG